MSLLNTKPRWFRDAVASECGWINPKTGEVLIAIGNLKVKLEAEENISVLVSIGTIETETITPIVIEPTKEVSMETKIETETPVKVKREYNKKPKVIGEVVEEKLETSRQIIGEVVEHDLDK